MIDVQTYPVAHDKNGGGGGGKTYMMGGQSNVPSDLFVHSINASLGNIKHLTSTSMSANDANFIYVTANDGNIYKIKGNDLDYYNGHIANLGVDFLTAESLDSKNLSALKATIDELISQNITTKDLTVTGKAHFFELVIDKIRSVGGQLILTPTSCIVDYVEYYKNGNILHDPADFADADYFNIYWRGSDPYGRKVNNEWIVGDQAICQSFNNVAEGTNNNVTNKKYWMLVNQRIDDKWINLKTGETITDSSAEFLTSYNTISMMMYDTTWTYNNIVDNNDITWNCAVQTVDDSPVEGVRWADMGAGTGCALNGYFMTSNKLFGLKITPSGENANRLTDKLKFSFEQDISGSTAPASLMNVTVTFQDDTFMYFNNVQAKKDDHDNYVLENGHYIFELDLSEANMPISIITVVCAQDVEWHKCHGIMIGNGDNGKWAGGVGYPEIGDNLVQLGYRYGDEPDRQSAIIISAYKSPDSALKSPSYAHYQGINNFELDSHRGSYFDANGARFVGDITFANIGELSAVDKWMKLNYASSPISTQKNEDGTRSNPTPSTFSLNISSVDNNEFTMNSTTHEMKPNPDYGKTVTLNSVPSGYSVFMYYYDKDGLINIDPASIYADDPVYGGSLTDIPAPNAVEVQGNTKLVMKIVCRLVKGIVADANIIDEISITYDEHKCWDTWSLIPEKEVAYATILEAFDQTGGTSTMNDQKVQLNVDLQYTAGHYNNADISNVEFSYPSGIYLRAHVYYQTLIDNDHPTASLAEYQTNNIRWTYTDNQGNTSGSNPKIHGSFKVDNYLATLHGSTSSYRDYMLNYTNNRDKNPVMFEIELVDGRGLTDVILDKRTVYVSMQSGAIMKITQNSIVSAVSSSNSYTDTREGVLQTQITNNLTEMRQTDNEIRGTVSSGFAAVNQTIENLDASVEMTAGQIRSEVKRTYGTTQNHLTYQAVGTSSYSINLTNTQIYAEDKYYEVQIIPAGGPYTEKHMYVMQIERPLSGDYGYWGKPGYGVQESPYGFDLMLNWTGITDATGGSNPFNIYVNEYYLQYSNGNVISTPTWSGSYFTVYVRGGSRYRVISDHTISGNVIIIATNPLSSINEPVVYKPTESSIEQTAEKISMQIIEPGGTISEQLKRTGIDIESGKITLNADNTIVNGNLSVMDDGSAQDVNAGLTLYDDSGNARVNITANDTPDPTSADGGFTVYNTIELASSPIDKSPSSGATGATIKKSLGTFSTGDNIRMTVYPKISGVTRDAKKIIQDNIPYPLTCRVNLYYHGGSTVVYTSGDKYVSRNGTAQTGYYYSSFSWDLTNVNAGTYDIEFKITSAPESANGYTGYWISSIVDYSKITESLTYVGLDGVLVGTSSKQFAKISKDGFEFRWISANDPKDGYGIKINNDGIMRPYKIDATNGITSWVAFDGYSKATVLTPNKWTKTDFYIGDTKITNKYSYVVKPNDTSIFVPYNFEKNNESEFYIRLCDGAGNTTIENHETDVLAGRKLIIRNLSDKTVYICPGLSSNDSHPNNTTRTATQKILNRASDGGDFMTDFDMNDFSYTMMTIPYRHSATVDINWAIMHRD